MSVIATGAKKDNPVPTRDIKQQPPALLPFDQATAVEFAASKARFLDWFFERWRGPALKTAFDAGTGIGYFAAHLASIHGLQVTAVDARPTNVEEATRRHPNVRFFVTDVESPAIISEGKFDLVTALGLLYHLENPFLAIRNLVAITRQALLIESLIAPGRGAKAWLLDEFEGQDQGVRLISWHLTEPAIAKLLYRSGIPYVYQPRQRPAHPEFHGGFFRRQTRAIVVASRIPLDEQHFTRIQEPFYWVDRAYYMHFGTRGILRRLLDFRRSWRQRPSRHELTTVEQIGHEEVDFADKPKRS